MGMGKVFKDEYGDELTLSVESGSIVFEGDEIIKNGESVVLNYTPKKARKIAEHILELVEEVENG